MKPGIRKAVIALTAVFAFGGTAQATPIDLPFFDGEIAFVGLNWDFGEVVIGSAVPTGGSGLADATGIDFADTLPIGAVTGDFVGVIPGVTMASFNDIVFNPSTPVNPLWVINVIVDALPVVYSFAADSFTISDQNNGFLSIWGNGYISATGYQDTAANWSFTLTEAGDILQGWASTTATVSEPGTLALFGLSLLGLGLARRRRV